MIIVGDIGNSETKICLVNNKKKIIKKITLNTKKINLSLLKKSLAISSFDPKLINKCLFCSVVPKKFNKIKNFFRKEYKIKSSDVASNLKNKGVSFTLDLLGDGPKIKQIEELALKYKIDDLVNFRGIVNNPQSYLKSADLYVHSAKEEAFGLVLIEAMASGLPVFTTDGGGNRGLIKDNHNGFFFKDRKPKPFANKIIELFENPDHYFRMSNNCKEYAKNMILNNMLINLLNSI